MGLAGPRKRVKLSHDPNNTAWTLTHSNSSSFGSRYMQSSGWVPGTALGASSIPIEQATSSKVKIAVKDDMLGLGASLKSKNLEHQRTGLDAFQGLLGRLNAKDDAELKKVEEKIENKKLFTFAQGRWGTMVFVPGGLLVQDDPKKVETIPETQSSVQNKIGDVDSANTDDSDVDAAISSARRKEDETTEERAQRKAAKRKRKDERAAKKEAKRLRKVLKESGIADSTTSNTSTPTTAAGTGTSTPLSTNSTVGRAAVNGRALLRGKNYAAKRMAFSDSKGLDQIFMRTAQTA
ncbi:hypothetical protein BT93_L5724 [Corymbia citriodora subsp. variegata]|uniref:PinX1-related protein 1 n=1 Tax=Corymbia citriodora subsp. variegata TaxID=360336 RepID=A0A8T0CJ41_CORYI|nr:hypothetical protein BT93_L5724 [Corymbia citriodora subsp. variegata]